jgi:hypothetical protein
MNEGASEVPQIVSLKSDSYVFKKGRCARFCITLPKAIHLLACCGPIHFWSTVGAPMTRTAAFTFVFTAALYAFDGPDFQGIVVRSKVPQLLLAHPEVMPKLVDDGAEPAAIPKLAKPVAGSSPWRRRTHRPRRPETGRCIPVGVAVRNKPTVWANRPCPPHAPTCYLAPLPTPSIGYGSTTHGECIQPSAADADCGQLQGA